MFRFLLSGALALATLLCFVSVSSATSYGNFSSPTGDVSFLNVEDANGLFGSPTASGNSLDFSPNAFEADCAVAVLPACPPTPHEVSDLLILQIDANAGFFIEEILLTEAGDTTLFSLSAAIAATTIVGDVFIDVLEIDGAPVNGVNGNATMVFTSDGTYDTTVEGSGTHIWTGTLLLDVDAVIAAAVLTGQAPSSRSA